MAAPTSIVVHPQPLVRAGIAARLEQTGAAHVIATAGHAHHTIRLVQRHMPQLLVIAAALPGVGGLAVARALRHDTPALRTILIHQQPTTHDILAAAHAGIAAWVPLIPDDVLIAVIPIVAAGYWPILATLRATPQALWQLCMAMRNAPDPLAPRERAVLQGIAAGQTDRQIAAALALSLATVKMHSSTLRRRLGTSGRRCTATRALAWGLIASESIQSVHQGASS